MVTNNHAICDEELVTMVNTDSSDRSRLVVVTVVVMAIDVVVVVVVVER